MIKKLWYKIHNLWWDSTPRYHLKKLNDGFNPFYRCCPFHTKQRRYLTFNWFVGYSWFDTHYWSPEDRTFLDGGVESKYRLMMVGLTLFHLRFEVFFKWGYSGYIWRKYG